MIPTMYTDDVVTKIYISSLLPFRVPVHSNSYDISSSTMSSELSAISRVSSERFLLFPCTRCMTSCHQRYFVREICLEAAGENGARFLNLVPLMIRTTSKSLYGNCLWFHRRDMLLTLLRTIIREFSHKTNIYLVELLNYQLVNALTIVKEHSLVFDRRRCK